MNKIPEKLLRGLKVVVFLACLGPLAVLTWKAFHQLLGANPVDVITRSTGKWTLVFLLVTLAVTPARRLLRMPWLIRFRRMLGLFAFFYGTLHLMTYVWLDQFFNVQSMLHDIAKRRFITAGMTAFALMVPLAFTSTRGWIRRMGGKRWQKLHRLIYFSAAAGVIHFLWLVKADRSRPLAYGLVLLMLLLVRLVTWLVGKLRMHHAGAIIAAPALRRQVANTGDEPI
ncbi:MAG TPA: protein-methionine-sulfoxide reductase heme-binding subunit MsrQ [Candidatus Acidoferrales bacterium]|jgi:sulfoxide reductase heme-binding subunit YedZ|nr:protein-methionine-sulfoxide reductase heme-binding subunit MsrQ [Candidatus Acidoferrales bacterium]